jgi:hypothetical protein
MRLNFILTSLCEFVSADDNQQMNAVLVIGGVHLIFALAQKLASLSRSLGRVIHHVGAHIIVVAAAVCNTYWLQQRSLI